MADDGDTRGIDRRLSPQRRERGKRVARLGLQRDALEVARRLARSAIVTAKGCDAGLPQLAREHRLKEELEIARADGVAVSVLGPEPT